MAVHKETVKITKLRYSETSGITYSGQCAVPKQITYFCRTATQYLYCLSLRHNCGQFITAFCLVPPQLHNVVQRHFITSTSCLLQYDSISRTVSKTPSKFLLSDNQPADGTEDFHRRCIDSKFLVFLKPFSIFPYIYDLDSPGFGSRKREKIFPSAKTVQTSCGAHAAFKVFTFRQPTGRWYRGFSQKMFYRFEVPRFSKTISNFSIYLRPGQSRLRIPEERKNFPFCKNRSDQLWGPPSLQFDGRRCSFPGLQQTGHEVDHSPPASVRGEE